MREAAFTTEMPAWVEPSPAEPGSIDPLGYLARSESLAEQLLPGVTVATRRVRYLSFLCWAIRKTENDPRAIDRWEVALSMGEHSRHAGDHCAYLGSRLLLQQRKWAGADPLPRRLHVQTARMLYAGLLRSCGLAHENGSLTLTSIGERIADDFGRDIPRSMPKRVTGCYDMPCLSEIRSREASLLRRGFLDSGTDAEIRQRTKLEIGFRRTQRVRRHGAGWLLRQYLKIGRRSRKPHACSMLPQEWNCTRCH